MIHPGLTIEKWNSLSLEVQLGNIGAEVARMLNLLRKSETESAQNSLERALELIDLTITDPKQKVRIKELLRLREVLCARIFALHEFAVTDRQLIQYFLPFAQSARSSLR